MRRIAAMLGAVAFLVTTGTASAQSHGRTAKLSKGDHRSHIRLTPIPYELAGSNCSLFLDQSLRTFVGGAEYGIDEPWYLGINGKRYTLRETQHTRSRTVAVGRGGAPRVVISTLGMVRSSGPYPMPIDRVSVVVTLGDQIQTLQAYQHCGEG